MLNENKYQVMAAMVDLLIRDRIGNAYEAFYHDGAYYINAPLDESESEQVDAPCCAFICYADEILWADELYSKALRATYNVDLLMPRHGRK